MKLSRKKKLLYVIIRLVAVGKSDRDIILLLRKKYRVSPKFTKSILGTVHLSFKKNLRGLRMAIKKRMCMCIVLRYMVPSLLVGIMGYFMPQKWSGLAYLISLSLGSYSLVLIAKTLVGKYIQNRC